MIKGWKTLSLIWDSQKVKAGAIEREINFISVQGWTLKFL